MAVVTGTEYSSHIVKAPNDVDPLGIALVLFTVSSSQTYAQADNGSLANVHTIIGANNRRNGKTVTLRDAMLAQCAKKNSNPSLMMGLKTVAISTNDITFEITESATANSVDVSTELANGAVPAQSVPFGLYVLFTEA